MRKAIENFVKNKLPKLIKQNNVSREDQGLEVQQLMSEMTEKFMEVFPAKGKANEEEDEWNLNGEGIENCVMKNLFQDLFKHPQEASFNKHYVK